MSIREISVDKLRRMEDQEGLIIQGCGGDLQEWVDGINEILTEEGILKKGTKFEDVYSFQRGEVTCLLFPFKDDVPLDVGKLAMWRLQTYQAFGSTFITGTELSSWQTMRENSWGWRETGGSAMARSLPGRFSLSGMPERTSAP